MNRIPRWHPSASGAKRFEVFSIGPRRPEFSIRLAACSSWNASTQQAPAAGSSSSSDRSIEMRRILPLPLLSFDGAECPLCGGDSWLC
jgi:hypothetical protein